MKNAKKSISSTENLIDPKKIFNVAINFEINKLDTDSAYVPVIDQNYVF